MTSTLLLYKDITALDRERHALLRLADIPDCTFAGTTHLIPLAGAEFIPAARHYPILFVGEGPQIAPVALLGLRPEHNAFVMPDQSWRPDTYIPAYVRRYPFVLADDGDDRFTVCIDAACPHWSEEQGRPLFEADGRNTPFLDDMMGFMQEYTREMQRTRHFVTLLTEMGLLVRRSMQLTHTSGATFTLNDFDMVDEARFAALSDADILTLHHAGFLPWIQAHLMSLACAQDLFAHHLAQA